MSIAKEYKKLNFKGIIYNKNKTSTQYMSEIRKIYTINYVLDINSMRNDTLVISALREKFIEKKNRNLGIHYPSLMLYAGALLSFLVGSISLNNDTYSDLQFYCCFIFITILFMSVCVIVCTKKDEKLNEIIHFYTTIMYNIETLISCYK